VTSDVHSKDAAGVVRLSPLEAGELSPGDDALSGSLRQAMPANTTSMPAQRTRLNRGVDFI
jgi:hypothetical protein